MRRSNNNQGIKEEGCELKRKGNIEIETRIRNL